MTTQFKITPNKAVALVERALRKQITPILKGSPGIGKSDIMRQIAKKRNLKLIDIRLAQIDPVELNGFPNFLDNGKATYAPMDIFPTMEDEVPEGYKGWLLFFDEITSANRAVQAAAYKIILDRMVGQHKLHPNAFCVAAGNLSSDKAVVNQMSTALQSRMSHLTLTVDHQQWIDWALENNIDARVISFLQFNKPILHSFDPNHNGDTFPCPRTWAFTSMLVEDDETIGSDLLPLIAGTVGDGAASEFFTFCSIWQDLPSFNSIVTNPEMATASKDGATNYAATGMLASSVCLQTIEPVCTYMRRMNREFQLIFLRMAFKYTPQLIQNSVFHKMMKDFQQDLKGL